MSRFHRTLLAILITGVLLALAWQPWNLIGAFTAYHPNAVYGVFDLREWDLAKEGVTKLDGDWEFYWNALLSPDDLSAGKGVLSGYTDPRFWNGYTVDGRAIPGQGYATYVMRVLLEPDGERLGIRIPSQSTSYRLYINGRETASNGKVGTSAREYVPQYMPLTIEFNNDVPELTLIMQVSNFFHRRGGMWDAPEIGTADALRVKNSRLTLMDMVSIGSMFTMGFYHLFLFMMRKKDKSPVYFAGICFCFGIRAMIVGEIAVTKIWPGFSWSALLRLEYFTSGGILPFALLFLWELYPTETSKIAVRAGIALYAIFSFIVAVFPTTVGSQSMVCYQVGGVAAAAYALYVLVSASMSHREGAAWLAASTLFFTVTLVNDMLYFNGVLSTTTMSSLGLVVVCYAQAYVLASRFSGALTSVELLRDELTAVNQQLTELNRGLEQRVSERTVALVESNKRLEAYSAEIERIEQSRKHLLANIAHDLRTPVTLIQGYVEAMLDGVIDDPEQLDKYLWLIAGKASGLSHLISDLFELTQLEARRVNFNLRPVQIDDLIQDLYLKYEGDVAHAGVTPVLVKPSWSEEEGGQGPSVDADPEHIDRVISNLIYNALKFTPKGGTITVSYKIAEPDDRAPKLRYVVVSVADTGTGISNEDIPYIFDRFYKIPRARNQVVGSGLGLSIAREIVELHGGRIWAESPLEKGSTFSFTLPVSTRPA